MSIIVSVEPTLLVKNILTSAAYYREKLGFTYDNLIGHPPHFCIVYRDGCSLMLSEAPPQHSPTTNSHIVETLWDVYISVDDVTGLYEELRVSGAAISSELKMTHYGVKEFRVRDHDGHILVFGEASHTSAGA
jgi:uncharacterized glyoxalase superfamily protein PhnB